MYTLLSAGYSGGAHPSRGCWDPSILHPNSLWDTGPQGRSPDQVWLQGEVEVESQMREVHHVSREDKYM